MHDVTYRRLGSAATAELDKLAVLFGRRGAREVDSAADAQVIVISAPTVGEVMPLIDRLGFEERRRAVLVGVEGKLDVRETPKPGTLGALVESHRPLGVIAVASIRKWKSHAPELIGSKRLAERLGCGFHKAMQTANYAAWLNAPGESAAEMILALVAANRAISEPR